MRPLNKFLFAKRIGFAYQWLIGRPIFLSEPCNLNCMFGMELRYLQHQHPHERIQKQRQDKDSEHRSPISDLIAKLARKDQSNARPVHAAVDSAFLS